MFEHLLLKVNRIARNPHWYISSLELAIRERESESESNNLNASDEEVYILVGSEENESIV